MFSSNTTQVSANAANYIEDVFSTYLYTGNDTGQTITNNIDLSTKGGLVWCKNRTAGNDHALFDTVRGVGKSLSSDYNGQQLIAPAGNEVSAFNTNGFTLGTDYNVYINRNTYPYASWTFRKQPKFFDIVTWTGNNADGRLISHSLGSTPGMVIIKNLTSTYNWVVWHKNLANPSNYLVLNSTAATATDIYGPFGSYFAGFTTNASCFTSTGFYVAADARSNLASNNYVAYVFASNAGGFGAAGTDNVITCGSFTTSSYYATVNLGYEPQWILYKRTDSTVDGDWQIADNMRGLLATANSPFQGLQPNLSAAESSTGNIQLTSTGFVFGGAAASPYIYIAIRRGPMKTPTTGTQVYNAIARSGTGAAASITSVGFPPDLAIIMPKSPTLYESANVYDKLRGIQPYLKTGTTAAENSGFPGQGVVTSFDMNGLSIGPDSGGIGVNYSGYTYINWFFGRAPGFFDEVCYTSTSSNQTVSHNLGVAPELILLKSRSGSGSWATYCAYFPTPANNYKPLNTNYASTYSVSWGTMTSSTFIVCGVNYSPATTAVAYLFATCAGVSKVGSYTGNGTTQTINCGFGAGGARFVLITKSTELSTGDWYVYDTARGMTVLTDPYLLVNDTAAQVATLGSVTTVTTGFALNSSILAAINNSGDTYIFLAIA